ncbi:hypothetical protein [Morganella psychrotolerans]|uniref:Uncharacterized protein n=1 Tax=Morganella psychrotolerans TaxID=368603 RepID=A0A1B8HMV7_9GAMM|nr:hypothetical protein [Morganella psychrotolerans]OBU10551.1 hypothetical protein AYY17_15520 [Morganella psychrotolerans]
MFRKHLFWCFFLFLLFVSGEGGVILVASKQNKQHKGIIMNNLLSALRSTAQVQPDIAIPSSGKVTGFLFDASKIGGFRGEHIAVYPAWSKANSHGVAGNDVSLSGGRSLFFIPTSGTSSPTL